jgi:K+/H+ antiporter YhaU regulatory subunit KhtT
MNDPTKYEILQAMASRRKEMEDIGRIVGELTKKIEELKQRREDLKNLNFLDAILLKELYNGTD